MNNEEYYTENVIIDRDDLYINMDKFESGKCNVILVTGFSGSGKSTLGKEMVAKYKCDDHFELDALEWWFDGLIREDALKEGMPPIYDWLIHNKKLMNLHRPTNAEIARMMDKLIPHVIKWCEKNKNKKYVVEGIQLYESWAENDKCNYLEYPMVLKGTSGLKSVYRAMKRNRDKITAIPFYLKWLARSNKQVDALYKAMKEAYENEEVTEEVHEHHDEADAMRYAMDFLNKYSEYSKESEVFQEESFMSEYLQSSHPRKKKKVMNDEGKEVPDKCTKCGGDIGVFIQGEPVYLCKNCKKYFGTVKFPSKKKNKPLTESVDQECDYVFTEDSKFDFEKAMLGTDYVKNLRKVDILNAKLKNKKITQEQFDKEYAKISTVNADGFVMTIPKNGSEGGKPKVVRPNKDKPGSSFKEIKKSSNDKSSYNGNIKSKSDAEKFDHYNAILRRTEDYREYKDAFKNMARLLGNPNACTIKIMANSGRGKINGECFNSKQSAGCSSSDKLYHTSNQKGITRLNGKFRGHEGFYFSSKRVYFHKNNPGSINTSSNTDYIAKDGEYVYQFMGNPSSAFVDPEIKGSAVFIETDTSIPVKDVTDQFKKKSKPVTESVDPECDCLVAFMEAAVKNTTILKDLIYPIVEKTFITQANVRKYKMLISQFFEKNTPKLTTPGPQYLIVFGDADKDEFYRLFGITKEEIVFAMKNVIKSAGSSAEFKYLTNNPFLSFLYYIIRYFTLHHDDKALNATLGLFSIDVYWSIFTKYFPNGVIEPVMNYTIDNLTDKFIIKKAGTIFGALTESAKHSYEFHKSKIRTGNDPDCIAFLQRIRNDQNSMFRTISGIYYDNHKKGNAITTRNDDYDPENPILDDITSASTEVQATVNRVCMPMIANGVDISLAEAAAAIGNVSVTNLRIYLMKIFVNERLDEITQIVESILFLYINGEHKSSRDIRSAHFLYWTYALFKKTNSKDGNIVRINTILNRWGEETGIYKAFKSEGSKINYKRAIFTYIAMCIQKYN